MTVDKTSLSKDASELATFIERDKVIKAFFSEAGGHSSSSHRPDAQPARGWKVLRASASSTTSGDTSDTDVIGTYSGSSSGADTAVYRAYETYVIDTGSIVYKAQECMRWRWSHPARLAVNGNVKYYLDGRHIHLLDEDGKEHEVDIVKQILKRPPTGGSNA
jgi:hypothetical protein